MIPVEAMGHLCLLVWANDQDSIWSVGIVRMKEKILSQGRNRDRKRTITANGRQSIHWVFKNEALPPNVLLQLPRDTVNRIMKINTGQRRVDEILRVAQRQLVGRGVVATLARQDDYMKRVRGNGGSRSRLKPEGIIILGHYTEHQRIAAALSLPVPRRGELVSVRVVPALQSKQHSVFLDGGHWRVACESDPITAAPNCPHF